MLTLRDFVKVSALAAGTILGSAAVAQADCRVTDTDKTAFLGTHKTYKREFSGSSVVQIWERYCKPFIQRTIAEENITNGNFSMHCTGRLSCHIEGRVRNGRVITTRLDFGAEGQGRVSVEPAPVTPAVRARTTVTADPAPARPPVRIAPSGSGVNIYNDPGWSTFDAMVANCDALKRGKAVAADQPSCKR